VQVDYSLIRYVFSNLLNTAQKFSPRHGMVEIKMEYLVDNVQVQVIDHGIGIPIEEQEKIFQSFYRAKNVGNISGTGVGLSIVSEFIKLHQGQIRVKSEVNEGSIFTVSLPKNGLS
jgi:signal transduction histidine kinase